MSKIQQGGSVAKATGNTLENCVEYILQQKGYEYIDKKKFKIALALEQKIYTKQVHLTQTIYDSKWNMDFVLYKPESQTSTLVIECKWQQAGGSVDEKIESLAILYGCSL